MTYISSEQSTHSAKPNELYRFTGTYGAYYYTSGPERVSFQADDETEPHIYEPVTLRRSEIIIGTLDDDGTDLTVEMPVKLELVKLYGFKVSPPELNLRIFRYHSLEEDYAKYWQGDINNITVAGGLATLRSSSILAQTASAEFPNVFYQRPCNHILFNRRCGQLEADWSVAGTITAVAGRTITVSNLGAFSGQLVGGELALGGERRMIVKQEGLVVTVNFPFATINVGEPYAMTVGCDHDWSGDCATRFNNQARFGGFRHIPPENPFAAGIDPAAVTIADNTCLPPRIVFEGWWMKVRVDFWANPSGCGPDGGMTGWFVALDNDIDVEFPVLQGVSATDGSTDRDIALYSGAHTNQGYEFTFYKVYEGYADRGHTDGTLKFGTDFTRDPHRWQLHVQFGAGEMTCAPASAMVLYKKWDMPDFVPVAPVNPGDIDAPPYGVHIGNIFASEYEYFF